MNIPHSSIRCARKIGLKVKQIITLLVGLLPVSIFSQPNTLTFCNTVHYSFHTGMQILCRTLSLAYKNHHSSAQNRPRSLFILYCQMKFDSADGKGWIFDDVMMSYLASKVSVAYLPPSSCTICLIC